MNTSEKITQLQQAMSLLAQKIVMLNPDYRELHGRLQLLLEIQKEESTDELERKDSQ